MRLIYRVEVGMKPMRWGLLIALMILTVYAGDAFARAGGGGSRGSRSSSAPAQPVSPSSPSRQMAAPASPVAPAPQPASRGWMGGLMGGLAGFALGGLLGSMLFGGLGHGMGGGFGLLEILLIGVGIFLLFRFMSARRQAQPQPAYATAGVPYAGGSAYDASPQMATVQEPAAAVQSDLDRGLGHIRSMDPTFDPGFVSDAARGLFGDVQRALTARDMTAVSGRLTSRMYTELTEQVDRLRSARQTNRMEAVNVRRVDVSEAWQESGQDFVTVYLGGSLVDYTVDDATGAVVTGSQTPQEFEEFWTFTRPVGPNPWRLSAIQTP
jgi:predicted lipid-binding transport protein (Tim44 family)